MVVDIQNNSNFIFPTLEPIESFLTDDQSEECWMGLYDTIGYNSSYYYPGCNEFEEQRSSCVFQKFGEYQVLRFFSFEVGMCCKKWEEYLMDKLEENEDDSWMDDLESEENEMTINNIEEYKQVWIDRFGNVFTKTMTDNTYLTESFVYLNSTQDWLENVKVALAIFNNVKETEYCYIQIKSVLKEQKLKLMEKVRKYSPVFVDEIIEHNFIDTLIHHFDTFKVLISKGAKVPRTYRQIEHYFSMLKMYEEKGKDLLDINVIETSKVLADYKVLQAEIARKKEQEAKLKAKQAREDFNKFHSYLFGFDFESETFHYQSLDSVEAYYEEGELMEHCIFRCGYYKNHHLLALHITDKEGNRVATCTVNVKNRSIDQIQPKGNDGEYNHNHSVKWRDTNDYKEIWNCLMARMHTFPKYQEPVSEKVGVIKVA